MSQHSELLEQDLSVCPSPPPSSLTHSPPGQSVSESVCVVVTGRRGAGHHASLPDDSGVLTHSRGGMSVPHLLNLL